MNRLTDKVNVQQAMLFAFRVWFGITMMENGRFIFDKENEAFFLNWFGNDLHFPAPLLMFYLAKGSEFFGGLFLCVGFISKIAAAFISITMLVATLTANINYIYDGDGAITISFSLFAILFILSDPLKWSLDYLLFRKKQKESVRVLSQESTARAWVKPSP